MNKKCSKCGAIKPSSHFLKGLHCRKCRREYMRAWKAQNREQVNARERKWKRENKDKVYEADKRYLKKHPWARTRRGRSGSKRKDRLHIKNYLTTADCKFLWFRDKAYELKRPSLDRIDPMGDYTIKNCRYIELSENCRRVRYIIIECCPKCGYKEKKIDTSYPDNFIKEVGDGCE